MEIKLKNLILSLLFLVALTIHSNKLLSNESGEFEEPALLLLLKSQVALDQYQKARETSKRIFYKYPQSPLLMYVIEYLGDHYVNQVNYESA